MPEARPPNGGQGWFQIPERPSGRSRRKEDRGQAADPAGGEQGGPAAGDQAGPPDRGRTERDRRPNARPTPSGGGEPPDRRFEWTGSAAPPAGGGATRPGAGGAAAASPGGSRRAPIEPLRSSSGPPRPPDAGRPSWGGDRRPPGRRRRRRRRLGAALLALVILAVAGGLVFGGWAGYRQFTLGYVFSVPPTGPEVEVQIPKGASLDQIGDILESSRVVPSGRHFESRAEDDGYALRFQPGTYTLREYDDYKHIVQVLVLTASAPSDKVIFPEGYTAREMALAASRRVSGFSGAEYVDLTIKDPLPYTVPGMKRGTRLEGLLFPATYEFPPLTTPRSLVDLQYGLFRKALNGIDLAKAHKKNLTTYDVIIIASMIEREVRVPAERRLVSAVIWNRLRLDMPLQIDATIIYGLARPKQVLTVADLKLDTPYNTYLHRGLPPTPICNPGVASLEAAADPASVDYLYYVVRNDGTGRHRFSNNYDQFLRDKEQAGL